MKYLTLAIAVLLSVADTRQANANDDALYGTAPPDDAVFVRFLGKKTDSSAMAFGRHFGIDADDTSYTVISASLLPAQPQSAYTTVVVNESGEAVLFNEPARPSKSKVHLLLLNATDVPVRLVANSGALEVIGSTEFGSANIRAVNPINTELSVVRGPDIDLLSKIEISLRRGEDLTFVVTDEGVEVVPTTYGDVIID